MLRGELVIVTVGVCFAGGDPVCLGGDVLGGDDPLELQIVIRLGTKNEKQGRYFLPAEALNVLVALFLEGGCLSTSFPPRKMTLVKFRKHTSKVNCNHNYQWSEVFSIELVTLLGLSLMETIQCSLFTLHTTNKHLFT